MTDTQTGPYTMKPGKSDYTLLELATNFSEELDAGNCMDDPAWSYKGRQTARAESICVVPMPQDEQGHDRNVEIWYDYGYLYGVYRAGLYGDEKETLVACLEYVG